MDKKNFDYLTTLLLVAIPFILLFKDYIIVYTPPEYLILVTLFLAMLSQFAANQRVKDAIETAKHWKIVDYLTTILFAFGPLILAYQALILKQVPVEYVPIATILFGLLSQFVTNKRVHASTPVSDADTILLEHED